MGEMLIRLKDETMIERLESLARVHHRSVESEVLDLLNEALSKHIRREDLRAIANDIAAMTPKGVPQTSAVEMLREDRNR
jgi:plasmid stability protein